MLTLLFYGQDGSAAKTHAASLRIGDMRVRPIHAEVCFLRQAADHIEFMPDVSHGERERLCGLFDVPMQAPGAPALPPPPPAPVDPLADLGNDWRSRNDLRALAASISGRAVENAKQAVQVIETELAKRAAK